MKNIQVVTIILYKTAACLDIYNLSLLFVDGVNNKDVFEFRVVVLIPLTTTWEPEVS